MLDNQRSHRNWSCVLLFVFISLVLIGAGWHMIRAAGNEVGDFAANSLLIQDAKHLRLVYGHYSRIGFNHPGPAILYVQAAGELLFYDWLHLVPAPLGGQIIASLMYNAAWMALIFAIVRRMAGAAQALLFLAVLVLVALCIDPGNVNGIWFPHMYFFPYAAMLLAIGPLAYGRTDTLKALAVSTGFLLNGHASFIPMLAVILVLMLAANWMMTRTDRSRRVVSADWRRAHRRPLLEAIGILVLFLVPLMIATVKDFPGPLHDYVHYGRGNKGNPWPDALQFVLTFWGTGKMLVHGLVLALAVAVLLLSARPAAPAGAGAAQDDFLRGARGLGIAFVASTVSVLYYAKSGIDNLAQFYVALFYYTVPAMCAALVALFICRAVPGDNRRRLAVVATLIMLFSSWKWLRREPGYSYQYNYSGVVALYDRLHALPGQGRIVLDLDQGTPESWGVIWGNVLGLQAYARRRHDDLVCINENWNISNTRAAMCRPDELASARRFKVAVSDEPDLARGAPEIDADHLALYRLGAPRRPLTVAYTGVRQQPDYFRQILVSGWSQVGGDYVWSDGPVARIDLPADPARGKTLTLDLGAFLPVMDMRHGAQAFVDGRPAGASAWSIEDQRHRFAIDLGPDPGAAKHIELRISNPVMPKDYGVGEDTRLLGLSLYGIMKETLADGAGK